MQLVPASLVWQTKCLQLLWVYWAWFHLILQAHGDCIVLYVCELWLSVQALLCMWPLTSWCDYQQTLFIVHVTHFNPLTTSSLSSCDHFKPLTTTSPLSCDHFNPLTTATSCHVILLWPHRFCWNWSHFEWSTLHTSLKCLTVLLSSSHGSWILPHCERMRERRVLSRNFSLSFNLFLLFSFLSPFSFCRHSPPPSLSLLHFLPGGKRKHSRLLSSLSSWDCGVWFELSMVSTSFSL